MSRARKAALVALAVLPLALTAVAQPILPDVVAVHFGVSGPDQWEGKAHLFVSAGIVTAVNLLCVGLAVLYEHLRATNNNDWFVLDDYGGFNRAPFPLLVVVLLVMAAVQGVLVGFNVAAGAGADAASGAGAGAVAGEIGAAAAGASAAAGETASDAGGAMAVGASAAAGGTAQMANGGGQWVSDILFAFALLLMWGVAAYLLFKGSGAVGRGATGSSAAGVAGRSAAGATGVAGCGATGAVVANSRPGSTERERKLGDTVRQRRALGELVLFLSLVVAALWCAARFGAGA